VFLFVVAVVESKSVKLSSALS